MLAFHFSIAPSTEPHLLVPRTQDVMSKAGFPPSFTDVLPGGVYESSGDGPSAGQPRISKIPTVAWSFKNATFAATLFLYAAAAVGLNTIPLGGYDEEKAKQTLGIPDRYGIPVMIVCGYKAPSDMYPPSPRVETDQIVYDGKFGATNPVLSGKP